MGIRYLSMNKDLKRDVFFKICWLMAVSWNQGQTGNVHMYRSGVVRAILSICVQHADVFSKVQAHVSLLCSNILGDRITRKKLRKLSAFQQLKPSLDLKREEYMSKWIHMCDNCLTFESEP